MVIKPANENNTDVVIISHTKSGWNRKHVGLIDDLCNEAKIVHIQMSSVDEIDVVLKKTASMAPKVLGVNGGDGTLDAVLTLMRLSVYFKEEPMILALPGGTTNMTHRSFGLRHGADKILKRFLRYYKSGRDLDRLVFEQVPLVVSSPDHQIPLYGFFLGTGAIPKAIQFTRQTFHKRGMKNPLSELASIAILLFRLFAGKTENDPVLRPVNLQYSFDNWTWNWFENVFSYVTSLDKILAGIRPNPPEGGFMIAGLNVPYKRLLMNLPHLWRGRTSKISLGGVFAAQIYEVLHMKIDNAWTLDGEIYEVKDIKEGFTELHISAGDPVRFVKV